MNRMNSFDRTLVTEILGSIFFSLKSWNEKRKELVEFVVRITFKHWVMSEKAILLDCKMLHKKSIHEMLWIVALKEQWAVLEMNE